MPGCLETEKAKRWSRAYDVEHEETGGHGDDGAEVEGCETV